MAANRDVDLADRMSEHEALMWNIEKDPWLNPSGSSLTLLDQPVDMEKFRRQIRHGVAAVPRLYQRVVPGFARISTPAWVPDSQFDFDHHVRSLDLGGSATERDLLDLASNLAAEPLDRTRPLWRFVVIDGVEGGRGAIWSVFHHAISDGIGQIRMAELYQQLTRDEPGHPEIDLETIVAEACASHVAKEKGGDTAASVVANVRSGIEHLARRQLGISRRAVGEIMLWPADTRRPLDTAAATVAAARHTIDQLTGSSNGTPGGSPLWKERSRHRHLEWVQIPLDALKAAANAEGCSINDAFMAGLTNAAAAYHAERDAEVDAFNTSFIVSTRSDNNMAGNSFAPVLVQLNGSIMTPTERMLEVKRVAEQEREAARKGGDLSSLAGVANLLPTSVVTRTARDRAARLDFATSNLRGAPFTLYCAGAKVEATIPLGPVAGTAANITALSYDGNIDIGVLVDPVAIEDPARLRRNIIEAFELILQGADK